MAIRLKAEERRRRLMRAARRLFTEKGYEGATMEEIARAADCSTGPLYHLFRTKREIFEAVLLQSLDLLNKQFRDEHRRADRSALERLEIACDHLIDLLAIPETTMFAREAPQVLGADVWRRMRDDLMLRGFEADLRDAMTSGEIDAEPPGPLAGILGAAIVEAINQASDAQVSQVEGYRLALRRLIRRLKFTPAP